MHSPKPIRGPEFQLSKSRSRELYWDQAVSVPALLNAKSSVCPRIDPEGVAPGRSTDSAAAAGPFRMVSVSE